MRTRKMLVMGLFAMFALPAHADQYQYVTLDQAVRAMKIIGTDTVVQSFCAPCGDEASRPIKVGSIEIGRIWEGESASPYESDGRTFWEVVVNGASTDLAYLYVRRHHKWENLALLLGLEVVKVPRYLAVDQLGQ